MLKFKMTKHASNRCQHRGFNNARLFAVIKYADRKVHRGRNLQAIWISASRIRQLGPRTPEGVSTDRLKDVCVLRVRGSGEIVTIFRSPKNKYRKAA